MSTADKDNRILAEFIKIYCSSRHKESPKKQWVHGGNVEVDLGIEPPLLCDECSDLLSYSVTRRAYCPQDPKPTCKNCEIHCYADGYRSRIREVMRFSGKRLILHGRFDLIFHYLF